MRFLGDFAHRPCHQKHEHRTHLLALALHDVIHDCIEQHDLGLHELTKLTFKCLHGFRNGRLNGGDGIGHIFVEEPSRRRYNLCKFNDLLE